MQAGGGFVSDLKHKELVGVGPMSDEYRDYGAGNILLGLGSLPV